MLEFKLIMVFLCGSNIFVFHVYSSYSPSALDSGTNGTVCRWEGELEKGSHGCWILYEFKMFIYLSCPCVCVLPPNFVAINISFPFSKDSSRPI
jgi:hypothetical protein